MAALGWLLALDFAGSDVILDSRRTFLAPSRLFSYVVAARVYSFSAPDRRFSHIGT